MSDDEFDNIPDEFAGINGIDWATLLSANEPAPATSRSYNSSTPPTVSQHPDERTIDSPFPEPESRSSAYFSDTNNMDIAFLTELDRVEQQVLQRRPPSSNAAPSASGGRRQIYFNLF
jgi:hypothetical protein